MKPKQKGITLVELLAVIAIIGIIGSIAFSMIQRIVKRSVEIRTATSIRQVGLATLSYANDHGHFPLPVVPDSIRGDSRLGTMNVDYLMANLLSYINEANHFRSPGIDDYELASKTWPLLVNGSVN